MLTNANDAKTVGSWYKAKKKWSQFWSNIGNEADTDQRNFIIETKKKILSYFLADDILKLFKALNITDPAYQKDSESGKLRRISYSVEAYRDYAVNNLSLTDLEIYVERVPKISEKLGNKNIKESEIALYIKLVANIRQEVDWTLVHVIEEIKKELLEIYKRDEYVKYWCDTLSKNYANFQSAVSSLKNKEQKLNLTGFPSDIFATLMSITQNCDYNYRYLYAILQGGTFNEQILSTQENNFKYFSETLYNIIITIKNYNIVIAHKQDLSGENLKVSLLAIPSETELLAICKSGETQVYEFKSAKVEFETLSKEICAFANTRQGGLILYGVEDDGKVTGTTKKYQEFDQSLQNSIRNSISPALTVNILEKSINQKIFIIQVPPWDKKEVYQFKKVVYIRRGTNVFAATPDESKKLYAGEYII